MQKDKNSKFEKKNKFEDDEYSILNCRVGNSQDPSENICEEWISYTKTNNDLIPNNEISLLNSTKLFKKPLNDEDNISYKRFRNSTQTNLCLNKKTSEFLHKVSLTKMIENEKTFVNVFQKNKDKEFEIENIEEISNVSLDSILNNKESDLTLNIKVEDCKSPILIHPDLNLEVGNSEDCKLNIKQEDYKTDIKSNYSSSLYKNTKEDCKSQDTSLKENTLERVKDNLVKRINITNVKIEKNIESENQDSLINLLNNKNIKEIEYQKEIDRLNTICRHKDLEIENLKSQSIPTNFVKQYTAQGKRLVEELREEICRRNKNYLNELQEERQKNTYLEKELQNTKNIVNNLIDKLKKKK